MDGGRRYPDGLPSRREDEPRAPQKPAGRYEEGEKYLLERELNQSEAEYQQTLEKMLQREEASRRFAQWEGDAFGLDDGRPGLELEYGPGGLEVRGDPLSQLKFYGLIALGLLVFVILVRSCLGTELGAGPASPAGSGAPAPAQGGSGAGVVE